jgi:hypothetical protein
VRVSHLTAGFFYCAFGGAKGLSSLLQSYSRNVRAPLIPMVFDESTTRDWQWDRYNKPATSV